MITFTAWNGSQVLKIDDLYIAYFGRSGPIMKENGKNLLIEGLPCRSWVSKLRCDERITAADFDLEKVKIRIVYGPTVIEEFYLIGEET